MGLRSRADAFPTQLILFFIWMVPGGFLSYIWRDKLAWTQFMSWYAILGLHMGNYLAWMAKRAAQRAANTGESQSNE